METKYLVGLGLALAILASEASASGIGSVLSGKPNPKPATEAPKSKPGRIFDGKIVTRPTTNGNRPEKDATVGGVAVRGFRASRTNGVIRIEAKLENTASLVAGPISYTISARDDDRLPWTAIANGQHKPIRSGAIATIRLDVISVTKRMYYKIDLSPALQASAECVLKPDITYVVRYTTSGNWVNVKRWANDLSDGFYASERARLELHPLGVQTRINKKETTEFDIWTGFYTRLDTTLQTRAEDKLERTFKTKVQAETFRDSLIALVPDRGFTVEAVGERY